MLPGNCPSTSSLDSTPLKHGPPKPMRRLGMTSVCVATAPREFLVLLLTIDPSICTWSPASFTNAASLSSLLPVHISCFLHILTQNLSGIFLVCSTSLAIHVHVSSPLSLSYFCGSHIGGRNGPALPREEVARESRRKGEDTSVLIGLPCVLIGAHHARF